MHDRRPVGRAFRRKISSITGVCAVVAVGVAAIPVPGDTTASHAAAVVRASLDIGNRQAVLDAYTSEFSRTEPDMGFTGDVTTCTAGTTSTDFQLSVLQRVNWYRNMAGLPDIDYSTTHHAAAQAGALISLAEERLSHTPAATAKCFSDLGYQGTSRSNLYLSRFGIDAIDGYIEDPGTTNALVGHRSWILHPQLRAIATGDATARKDDWRVSNALYIVTSQDRAVPRDGAIAWPPPGYVPDVTVYPRWSYSHDGMDFAQAQVEVVGPNGPVPVVVDARRVHTGPGIVFVPDITRSRQADVTYTVTIRNVTGAANSTVTYSTTLIPINERPELDNAQVEGHRCSTKDFRIYVFFEDPTNDAVDGFHDAKADDFPLFRVKKDVTKGTYNMVDFTLTPRRALDPSRSSYRFTFTIVDEFGASRVIPVTANVKAPGRRTLCPAHSANITRTRSGTKVSWSTVPIGAKATSHTVTVSPGNRTCVTKKNSCVVPRLKKGRYTITITSTRSGIRPVTTSKKVVLS